MTFLTHESLRGLLSIAAGPVSTPVIHLQIVEGLSGAGATLTSIRAYSARRTRGILHKFCVFVRILPLRKHGPFGRRIQAVFELLRVDFLSPNCFLQLIECLFLAGLQILHHLLIVAEGFSGSFQLFSSDSLKLLRFTLDQVDILLLIN